MTATPGVGVVATLTQEWERLIQEFEQLLQQDTAASFWLPRETVYPTVMVVVVVTAVALTVTYEGIVWLYTTCIATPDTPERITLKTSYQLTNLLFNSIISAVGLYSQYVVVPTVAVYLSPTSLDKIPHLFDEFYLLPALQLGYQVWSLPMGLFVVHENGPMLLHHVGVVCAALLGAFSTYGFRYWLPFFFGIFELSSIPLAIMNTFNDHPHAQTQHPVLYHVSRISFVLSFLYIRIYLWCFVGPLYIRNNFLLLYTTHKTVSGWTTTFLCLQWVLGIYLGYLQLSWGYVVAKLGLTAVKNNVVKLVGIGAQQQQQQKKKKEL